MNLHSFDIELLRRCCELAYLCPASDKAYAVGCVIVNGGEVVAEGYSRQGGGNLHAEEVAIDLAERGGKDLVGGVLYSSMQPCGCRLSGVRSCQELILGVGINKVIYCVREPDYFLGHVGDGLLTDNDVEVLYARKFLDAVRGANGFVERWYEE